MTMDNIERAEMTKLACEVQEGALKSMRADIITYMVWGGLAGKDGLENMSELCYEIKRILQEVQWGGVKDETANT